MKRKILLLIEDNPLLSGMYETAFEAAGFSVLLAHNGDDGIAIAREKKPSNIILDLFMPGTDGFDVIRTLQADPTTKEIGIVVLTSDTKIEDLKKVKEMGAKEYLIKSELTLGEIVKKSIQSFR